MDRIILEITLLELRIQTYNKAIKFNLPQPISGMTTPVIIQEIKRLRGINNENFTRYEEPN